VTEDEEKKLLSTAPQKFQTHCLRLRARLFVARSSQISSG